MDKQSSKQKKVKKAEVVANCDQLPQVINHDLANINIESLIRTIRGQKVMVDFDLAMLYGVQNKRLNEQVKRNIERFPDDFMFQLTKSEFENLKSQFVTSSANDEGNNPDSGWGGTRKLPFAFTENGVAMLSGVLRSPIAIEANIRIMRAFTSMRH